MGKTMKHNNYSDYVILEEVETGDYKNIGKAFEKAAERLGCRPTQTSSRYYFLRNEGITYADCDYTEEDKENFNPGNPEKIQRSPSKTYNRPKFKEGYPKPWREGMVADEEGRLHEDIFSDESDNVIILKHNEKVLEELSEKAKNIKEEFTSYQAGEIDARVGMIAHVAANLPKEARIRVVKMIMKDL